MSSTLGKKRGKEEEKQNVEEEKELRKTKKQNRKGIKCPGRVLRKTLLISGIFHLQFCSHLALWDLWLSAAASLFSIPILVFSVCINFIVPYTFTRKQLWLAQSPNHNKTLNVSDNSHGIFKSYFSSQLNILSGVILCKKKWNKTNNFSHWADAYYKWHLCFRHCAQ